MPGSRLRGSSPREAPFNGPVGGDYMPSFMKPHKMTDFFYMLKWHRNLEISDAIAKLRMHKHIPDRIACDKCGTRMLMHRDPSRFDLFRWVCRMCKNRRPIRYMTWAGRHRIPLMALLMVVRYYVEDKPVEVTARRTVQSQAVCAQIYEDLAEGQERYAEEMYSMLCRDVGDSQMIEEIKSQRGSFRSLSRYFPLHVVYQIVLDSLSQQFMDSNGFEK